MLPILKWAGGKQNLLNELTKIFLKFNYSNKTFYDVFVGGGSVFLHLENKKVVINDCNEELINVYRIIKEKPNELIKELKTLEKRHSSDYYYKIRSLDRDNNYSKMSNIKKAARTIYLNRTCFNGLMRYNKKGYFNVPVGQYKNVSIVFEDRIKRISNYLNNNNVEILNLDFEEAVFKAKKGDLLYFDPPYDYESNIGFTNYTKDGWTRNDLIRLKELCDRLLKKGCNVVISNNDTKFVNELFSNYKIEHIVAHRFINSNGSKRNGIGEVIIYG